MLHLKTFLIGFIHSPDIAKFIWAQQLAVYIVEIENNMANKLIYTTLPALIPYEHHLVTNHDPHERDLRADVVVLPLPGHQPRQLRRLGVLPPAAHQGQLWVAVVVVDCGRLKPQPNYTKVIL